MGLPNDRKWIQCCASAPLRNGSVGLPMVLKKIANDQRTVLLYQITLFSSFELPIIHCAQTASVDPWSDANFPRPSATFSVPIIHWTDQSKIPQKFGFVKSYLDPTHSVLNTLIQGRLWRTCCPCHTMYSFASFCFSGKCSSTDRGTLSLAKVAR